MTSLNGLRTGFAFGVSICMIAFAGTGDVAAQTRPSYLYVCARCHGYDGIGRNSETPNIAGQSRYYMRTQLDNFLSGRRYHPDMRYYAVEFSDRELYDLVDYYSKLSPR
jgi:cytochrome c553